MSSFWRHTRSGRVLALAVSLTVLFSAGCSDAKVMVAVKGSVVTKGKPVAGALVMFHPQSDPTGQTASGVTSDDGTFTISSGVEQGIALGTYGVTITWPDPAVKPTDAEMMMGMIEQGPDLLKGTYATHEASKLTARPPITRSASSRTGVATMR